MQLEINTSTLTLVLILVVIIVILLFIYTKRNRLRYWIDMARGKPNVEHYLTGDMDQYSRLNQEPDLKRGRILERIAILLLYASTLGGSIAWPYIGLAMAGLLAGIAMVSAVFIFALKWFLGYREKIENLGRRHMILSWYDAEGNEGVLFFERWVPSRRIFVDKEALNKALEEQEKKIRMQFEAARSAGEMSLEEIDAAVAAALKDLREKALAFEQEAFEKLKASEVIQKYFDVSIDADDQERYSPHIYTIYPNGDARRRCILCFPVKLELALNPDAQERIRMHYSSFEANVNFVHSIRVGTLHEVLFNGETMDGITVELPDDVIALDSQVQVFIATEFDWVDEKRLQGLRLVKPPPILDWFIRVSKALLNSAMVGKKLEDLELEIAHLRESRERLKRQRQLAEIEKRMEQPIVLEPPIPSDVVPQPEEPSRRLFLHGRSRLQILAFVMILLAVGAGMMLLLLNMLGYTLSLSAGG